MCKLKDIFKLKRNTRNYSRRRGFSSVDPRSASRETSPKMIFLFRKVHLECRRVNWLRFDSTLPTKKLESKLSQLLSIFMEKSWTLQRRKKLLVSASVLSSIRAQEETQIRRLWEKSFLIQKHDEKALNNLKKENSQPSFSWCSGIGLQNKFRWLKFPRYTWMLLKKRKISPSFRRHSRRRMRKKIHQKNGRKELCKIS